MAVILFAVNLIASEFPASADLTQEKVYTLSPGTRAILGKLDTPVTIRFYCTRNVTPTAGKPLSAKLRPAGGGLAE